MAFLQETQRSLRAYFLLVGAISAILGLVVVRDTMQLDAEAAQFGLTVPTSMKAVFWIEGLSIALLGVGFVIAGVKLAPALRAGGGAIKKLLYASFALLVMNIGLDALVIGAHAAEARLPRALIGVAITFYLLHNVKRLAHEAQHPGAPRVA